MSARTLSPTLEATATAFSRMLASVSDSASVSETADAVALTLSAAAYVASESHADQEDIGKRIGKPSPLGVTLS